MYTVFQKDIYKQNTETAEKIIYSESDMYTS